jgi:hypothetical protein
VCSPKVLEREMVDKERCFPLHNTIKVLCLESLVYLLLLAFIRYFFGEAMRLGHLVSPFWCLMPNREKLEAKASEPTTTQVFKKDLCFELVF